MPGPIPAHSIDRAAGNLVDEDERLLFRKCMRALDNIFLEQDREERRLREALER